MPWVKREIPPEALKLLSMLDEAGALCEQLETALTGARAHRDHLAREASQAGATRRDVAKAGRITAGRVQQLLT